MATQALGFARYGPQILDALQAGSAPQQALDAALSGDALASQRQIGVVGADGQSASHTGAACLEWAGDRLGPGYAVQGNILAGPAVADEMVQSFLGGTGSLAERLVASLEAGQAVGGDRRGQQSAAVLVEQAGYRDLSSEGIDTLIDLRVDDHPTPLTELRRLLGLRLPQELASRAMRFYNQKDYAGAAQVMAEGSERYPDSPDVLYNLACFESSSGLTDPSLAHLRQAIALDASYRDLAGSDGDFDPIRSTPGFQALISG